MPSAHDVIVALFRDGEIHIEPLLSSFSPTSSPSSSLVLLVPFIGRFPSSKEERTALQSLPTVPVLRSKIHSPSRLFKSPIA